MVAVEPYVEALAELCQHAYGLKTCHGHKDSEEEEDGRHIDAREHVGDALLHSALLRYVRQAAVEHLRNGPQQTQDEHDAHEWRQMGD